MSQGNTAETKADGLDRVSHRWSPPWRAAVLALLIGAPVFVRVIWLDPKGDFRFQAALAKEMGASGDLWTYSLYYPLQHFLSLGSHSQLTMRGAGILIVCFFLALRVALAEWYARDEGLSPRLSVAVALVVTFSMPAFDPRGLASIAKLHDIYLGQLSPNVWHNATTIMSMPFSVAAVMATVAFLKTSGRSAAVGVALFTLASTLAKPNFTLALLPAVVILLGWMGLKGQILGVMASRRSVAMLAIAWLPSLLVLGAQYVATFSEGAQLADRTAVAFEPLSQWSALSDNIPLSIGRSLFLPVLLTFLLARRRALDLLVALSWVCLAAAVVQFSLLTERDTNGAEVFHGNWSWAVVASTFTLFLSALVAYARDLVGPSGRWDRSLLGSSEARIVAATALVYVLAGAAYLLRFAAA